MKAWLLAFLAGLVTVACIIGIGVTGALILVAWWTP